MNIDGSRMRPGVHYNQTHAPVLAWGFIMILLSTVLLNIWNIIQLDYMLTFPQAPVDRECYIKITNGIDLQSDTECVFNTKKNI